ncbi:MAG: mechanosensitive ion channel family protein [Euryarchaeota archaeon]|nr:mechanosensitive ion channel family protein [Euryarchaeota archaeon]
MAAVPEIPVPAIDLNVILAQSWGDILLAIIALVVGFFIVKYIVAYITGMAEKKSKVSRIALTQVSRLISTILYGIIILIALGFLGVEVNGIIISISAFLALALGFGLNDTVNNIASGVWITSMNAFDKFDEVEIGGHHGTVMNLSIMATEIKKLDNTRVIIPNGKVWNSAIVNVSRMATRMLIIPFGISYNSSVDNAYEVALNVAKKHPEVHDTPAPIVRFVEMADSSVNLQFRAWTDTGNYYQVKSDVNKMLYNDLVGAGIEIPFPQMDLHLNK